MQFIDKDTVVVPVVMQRQVLATQKNTGNRGGPTGPAHRQDRRCDSVCGNNSTIHSESTEGEGSSSDSASHTRGRRACGDTAAGANVAVIGPSSPASCGL